MLAHAVAAACVVTPLLPRRVLGWQPPEGAAHGAAPSARPNILLVIADDWSFPHTGIDGMRIVPTPAIDRLGREGAHFRRAFVASPSCSPSRAAILTGQTPNRLGTGGCLSGPLDDRHPRYPRLLAAGGYHVGHVGKGYGPAWLDPEKVEKAGPLYDSFAAFLKARPSGAPFCFWFGSQNPHRPYLRKVTQTREVDPADVPVPAYLPDTPETRQDLADYYAEVAELDAEVADLLSTLEQTGEAANTLVVVCSDNGLPFPRAKANLYDAGTHSPLVMRWPARIQAGQEIDAFVNLADLGPTFLEAAGVPVPPVMNGVSVLPLVADGARAGPIPAGAGVSPQRDAVYLVREQHVPFADKGGYSSRGIRTAEYLYVLNLEPDRWPAGPADQKNGQFPTGFVDIDEGNAPDNIKKRGGGAKAAVVAAFQRGDRIGRLALDKRPAEELYVIRDDPEQMNNVAGDPKYAAIKNRFAAQLKAWMQASKDGGVVARAG